MKAAKLIRDLDDVDIRLNQLIADTADAFHTSTRAGAEATFRDAWRKLLETRASLSVARKKLLRQAERERG